jgi:predicted metal-binding protein
VTHFITLCASCPLGRIAFSGRLNFTGYQVKTTECMSGCMRPSTLAFRAEGKVAYLFGDIAEADLADIQTFAAAYLASPDGTFADARLFGGLRMKAIARIPA